MFLWKDFVPCQSIFSLHHNFQTCHPLEPNSVAMLPPFIWSLPSVMVPICHCPSCCDLLIYRCWGEGCCDLLLHVDHHAGLGFFWASTEPRSTIYKSVTVLWTELRSAQDPGTVQIAIYPFLRAKCLPGPFSVFKQNIYFLLLFFLLKIPIIISQWKFPSFLTFLTNSEAASPWPSLPGLGMLRCWILISESLQKRPGQKRQLHALEWGNWQYTDIQLPEAWCYGCLGQRSDSLEN